MRKKITFTLFLLGGFYLIVLLSRDLWHILGAKNRVIEAEQQVVELKNEGAGLEKQLEVVGTDEFIEKEAREKLMMGREGEVVVLLPQQQSVISNQQSVISEETELENWEKWAQLFVY